MLAEGQTDREQTIGGPQGFGKLERFVLSKCHGHQNLGPFRCGSVNPFVETLEFGRHGRSVSRAAVVDDQRR